MRIMSLEEAIIRWCEGRLKETETEIDLDEMKKDLRNMGFSEFLVENVETIMRNLRGRGILLYYEKGGKYILVKVVRE